MRSGSAGGGVPLPARVKLALVGRRFALLGFAERTVQRLMQLLDEVQAFGRVVVPDETPESQALLRRFDVLVVSVPEDQEEAKGCEELLATTDRPVILVGTPTGVLTSGLPLEGERRDFLATPVRGDELMVRACRLLEATEGVEAPPAPAPAAVERPPPPVVEPPPEPEPVPPPAPAESSPLAPPELLIADDDPTTVALVCATLQQQGLVCHVATTGQEALQLAKRLRLAAIILDVNMPELNGFEVLASIRNDRQIRDVPVLFLTARQQDVDVLRGFGLGADDYITKPFNPVELAARVVRLVKGRP